MRIPAALVLLFALTTAGCGAADAPSSPPVVVRDSAGIRIVESADGTWTDETVWRIDAEPSLAIGVLEGAEEYLLHGVRAAQRFNDGTIVVADNASLQLRYYDQRGQHIRSVGGEGAGPGEYGVISDMYRYGADSLIVWDARLGRGTVLARDGTFAYNFGGPDIAYFYFSGTFDDGSILGRGSAGLTTEEITARTEVRRHAALYFRYRPSGQVDTIGEFFTNESFMDARDGAVTSLPFARRAVHAVAPAYWHYGPSDAYELRTYTPDGELTRIVRRLHARRALTRAHIDAYIEAALERMEDPNRRREWRDRYDRMPFGETLPAYSDLLVDTEGNLWVREYEAPGDEPNRWTVFDAEGILSGTLRLPETLEVYEIGSDYLLGKSTDELGVERVVVHALSKPEQPRL